jgi:hypothetical protein
METAKLMLKCAVVGACAVLLAGAAQATLQDRDLNGDTVVDAFYDTDLDITWLRDANVVGPMGLNEAATWAANLSFAAYDDWRLPRGDWCWGFECTASEMGHLWCVEPGNVAGSPANVGGFQNVQVGDSDVYWPSFHELGYTSVLYLVTRSMSARTIPDTPWPSATATYPRSPSPKPTR